MEWIREGVAELSWWGDIVSQTANWDTLSAHLEFLPVAKKINEEISSEFLRKHLGEEEEVGDQSTLQNDWDVRGVEQLNRVSWWLDTLGSLVLNIKIDLEALEVDDNEEDENSGEDVVKVGES